ncbi:MAG: flagellar filament capping protein FliD [Deltaproteobacteria bacterium]|nr:flagellar filament capping protein FliD [Deltaproteobacteria bacterium]
MSSLISFSGLASGIDSSALIKATLDQSRAARITPLQNRIATLQDTNDSFSKLKELLSKLNTAASKFRTVSGGALAKSAASSDETIATASANGSAVNGSYSINVTQLARSANFSFNDRFASSSSTINSAINDGALAADRTVQVEVGTGSNQESISIELTSTTTISDFVEQFNAQSTKATASVVNVGTSSSPSYAISIASNNQGVDLGNLSVSAGSEIQSAGSGAFTASTITQAQNAEFTLSGVSGTISKSTNSVSDLLPGVTFNLQGTGSATISIADDSAATASKLQGFVDAYNEIVSYIAQNDSITRDESGKDAKLVFGSLSGTSLDEGLQSALRGAFSAASTSGNIVNTLADLGISTQRDGTLKFDSTAFTSALSSDPEGVRSITSNLGEGLSSVDGTIAQYTRFNGLIDTASKSGSDEISRLNERIGTIEAALLKEQESLTARFARLESLVGKLSSQQASLAQILPQ